MSPDQTGFRQTLDFYNSTYDTKASQMYSSASGQTPPRHSKTNQWQSTVPPLRQCECPEEQRQTSSRTILHDCVVFSAGDQYCECSVCGAGKGETLASWRLFLSLPALSSGGAQRLTTLSPSLRASRSGVQASGVVSLLVWRSFSCICDSISCMRRISSSFI